VFEESFMYRIHSYKTNRLVERLPTKEYQRAEEGFQCFMGVVILSIEDLNDSLILEDFFELKKWIYRHMGSGSAQVDQILVYLKWLTKICQALMLKSELPDGESYFPTIKGDKIPFRSGKFAFIKDLFNQGGRNRPLTKAEAYCLAQIASGTRALPYPSKHLVSKQVEETCRLISTRVELSEDTKRSHRGGLRQIVERLHEPDDFQTHISLSGSACDELPRSEGGKAAWLVANAKKFCETEVTPIILTELQGTKDVFGHDLLPVATVPQIVAKATDPENLLDIRVGDILYLEEHEATKYLDSLDVSERDRLPHNLAKVLLLEASREVLKFGTYNKPIKPNRLGLPVFERVEGLEFSPTVQEIPVTASLSIESSLKSRLVTAAPAGYTEIGQTINNFMRNYLSKDMFLKVGFEEPDKLWDVLKAYEKKFNSPHREN
jgi:hypothetical protein